MRCRLDPLPDENRGALSRMSTGLLLGAVLIFRVLPSASGPASIAPARIRFEDGFAYGGFVNLRVPIP